MKLHESTQMEFKDIETGKLPDSIPKTLVAFLNTEGGDLMIGMDDKGNASGLEDPDDVSKRLSSIISNLILPDAAVFIHQKTVQINQKNVIKVTVETGTERPYYLARTGLKPGGVFIRQGSTCLPVSEASIRTMIMDTAGKSFEEARSWNQELSFKTLEKEMGEFSSANMKNLRIIGEDGLFSNLGLLLSDQCPFSIKTALFQGCDGSIFRDRCEFSGSVLKQLEQAYSYLCGTNRTAARFTGLRRSDTQDYPDQAIREALLNCIVHRDYMFSGSTIINIYQDRIEFITLGGLVSGISMEAIKSGISQSRNPNLCSAFYRMKLVESYGTGIRKIFDLYKGTPAQPQFKAVQGAFVCTIFNRNEALAGKVQESTPEYSYKGDELDRIMNLAAVKGSVTRREIEEAIGLKTTKAFRLVKMLCASGRLVQKQEGRFTRYFPAL